MSGDHNSHLRKLSTGGREKLSFPPHLEIDVFAHSQKRNSSTIMCQFCGFFAPRYKQRNFSWDPRRATAFGANDCLPPRVPRRHTNRANQSLAQEPQRRATFAPYADEMRASLERRLSVHRTIPYRARDLSCRGTPPRVTPSNFTRERDERKTCPNGKRRMGHLQGKMVGHTRRKAAMMCDGRSS